MAHIRVFDSIPQMPHARVTAIGGGHGLSALLRWLVPLPTVAITAIVTVGDNGGSSGRLRMDRGIVPPGDLRRCLLSLSSLEPGWKGILEHRFEGQDALSGHSLGNLLLTSLFEQFSGDFCAALDEAHTLLRVRGRVLPVCTTPYDLWGTLADGSVVEGEVALSHAAERVGGIQRISLQPSNSVPTPGVLEAIAQADFVLIGPGSLYTSVLPPLLVPGIKEALQQTRARTVYICNPYTQRGETENYTASDHVRALVAHIGGEAVREVMINSEQEAVAVRQLVYPDSPEIVAVGLQAHLCPLRSLLHADTMEA